MGECLAGADRIAANFCRRDGRLDREEVRSVAREALVVEAGRLRTDRVGDQHAYLCWLVKQRVGDWLRTNGPLYRRRSDPGAWRTRQREESLDVALPHELPHGGETDTLVDCLPAREEPVELETRLALCDALRRLPRRERRVIFELFFRGRDGRELAAAIGVDESRVSQIRAKALRRLRAHW